jgi:DNA-directed RNA polymerase subunit H (RpoH/RPB5)
MINSHPDDIGRLVYGEDGTGQAKQCWIQLKARMQPTAITAFLAEKAHIFERTTGLALKILTSNLEKLVEFHDDPTTPPMKPDELAMIASIVTNMDKICRLETGKATQIVQQIGITPEEARKILQEDPMNQVVEAEYHEIMKSLEDA